MPPADPSEPHANALAPRAAPGESQARPTCAACVTPPGVGGIAVVQIVGRDAIGHVSPFLRFEPTVDLARIPPDVLRLGRWMDGNDTIDDAIVAVRTPSNGETLIDVNLHGGRRIVQRVLLGLQQAGVEIVSPIDLFADAWPADNAIEREILPLIMRAPTRRVASWLGYLAEALPARIGEIVDLLGVGNRMDARSKLDQLSADAPSLRLLLDGVRVVLLGEPNVGKSTLANALAGRDHAIVSDLAGTTRDWLEHRGAIDGIPFTFVDTAGLRTTSDPIEREAIERTRQQVDSADIVLWVLDVSRPPTDADRKHMSSLPPVKPCLPVRNKCDLPHNPGQATAIGRAGEPAIFASAATAEGLPSLQRRLLEAVGLANWHERRLCLVTSLLQRTAAEALDRLDREPPPFRTARALLRRLVGGQDPEALD